MEIISHSMVVIKYHIMEDTIQHVKSQ